MLRGRAGTLLLVIAALLLGAVFIAISGGDLPSASGAVMRGSFGSRYAIASGTLLRSVPLILCGLAVAWAFSAGVFNIGVEGQFFVGAAAATAVALELPGGPLSLLLALLAGSLAGALWAGVAAFLRRRFGVLEVISTIMLNFLAVQLVSWLVHGPLGDPRGIYPQSPTLPRGTWLPVILSGTRLHLGFVLALVACGVAWFVLRNTAAGFRLRLVGVSPTAAQIAGKVNADAVAMRAFLVSGAIGGFAGAIEVTGVTYALYESISPGYGYTAIAVAMLANLSPAGVIVSGIGFGALEAGAAAMQRDAGVPAVIASVVEATIILILAAVYARRRLSFSAPVANQAATSI